MLYNGYTRFSSAVVVVVVVVVNRDAPNIIFRTKPFLFTELSKKKENTLRIYYNILFIIVTYLYYSYGFPN